MSGLPRFTQARAFLKRTASADGMFFAALQTIATQSLVLVLNVISGILVARLLGPEGRGVYTAAILWPQFLSAALAFGVPSSATVYLKGYSEQRNEIVSSVLIITALASVIGVAIGAVLVHFLMASKSALAMHLALLGVLGTIPYLATNTFRQIFVSTGRVGLFNLSSYLPPALYIIAVVAALAFGDVTASVCVLAQLGVSTSVFAWLMYKLIGQNHLTTTDLKPWLIRLSGYALRAGPVDVIGALTGNIDRLVLVPMIAVADLGTYAVAYSLSRIVLVIQTSVTSLLLAKMSGLSREHIRALHDQTLRLVIGLVIVMVAAAGLLGRPLLTLFYGPAFGAANSVFLFLVIEAALTCVGQVLVQFYLALGRPGFVSVTHVAVFIALLPMLIFLVSKLGSIGAAVALSGAAALRLTILLTGVKFGLKLPFPRLWPDRRDLASLRARIKAR